MVRFILLSVRYRLVHYVGMFVAISIAVAMIASTGILMESVMEDSDENQTVISFIGFLSVLIGFISIFVVANTLAFSVSRRTGEIGALRLIGATPRQIRIMIAGEAVVISICASIAGCLAGIALSRLISELIVRAGISGGDLQLIVSMTPLVVSFIFGVCISLLSVLTSQRRASRIGPTQAVREASVESRGISLSRLLFGLLFLVGGWTLWYNLPRLGENEYPILVALQLAFAFSLLGPLLVGPLGWLSGAIASVISKASGWMAWENTAKNRGRTAGVMAPVMLIVTIACTLLFIQENEKDISREKMEGLIAADYFYATQDSDGIPASLLRAVRDIPGVSAVAGIRSIEANVIWEGLDLWEEEGIYEYRATGIDDQLLERFIHVNPVEGQILGIRKNEAAISSDLAEELADDYGLGIGDSFEVRLVNGDARTLEITAIFQSTAMLGDFLLSSELVAQHQDRPSFEHVYVDTLSALDNGDDPLLQQLHALAEPFPSLTGYSKEEYIALSEQQQSSGLWALYLLIGILGLYIAISIVNTVTLSTLERKREFSKLRLVGMTRSQILCMIGWEALIASAIGAIIGTGITVFTLMGHSLALTGSWEFDFVWETYVWVLSAALLLGVIPAILSGRYAILR
ncbi:FtsX-like permease family protein [Bacillus sp. JJ722]|uniref:FtsX-like permease family protein n=1 Tax=Bacillus sp. JJ722 TaxID=3122973 RepID=UPI00300023A9